MIASQSIGRLSRAIRWRLGRRVAAPELEAGGDESIASFYRGRITDCSFLSDRAHYEYPRAQWIIERVGGGCLLEVGCGNGGMTALLAPKVERVVAIDVASSSLEIVSSLALQNVETIETLVEHYQPDVKFDWIVMSEVLEHLRRPAGIVLKCLNWLAPGGSLLVSTPNSHWESNEHLQEFNLERFARILVHQDAESVELSHLNDSQGRRRWLVGQVVAPKVPASNDDFNNRRVVARNRQR